MIKCLSLTIERSHQKLSWQMFHELNWFIKLSFCNKMASVCIETFLCSHEHAESIQCVQKYEYLRKHTYVQVSMQIVCVHKSCYKLKKLEKITCVYKRSEQKSTSEHRIYQDWWITTAKAQIVSTPLSHKQE